MICPNKNCRNRTWAPLTWRRVVLSQEERKAFLSSEFEMPCSERCASFLRKNEENVSTTKVAA